MCLIVLAWQQDPVFDLLVAANRDEFHERPTEAAHWWPDIPHLFAGRDQRAGGAWCGVDRSGRFAAVTNVRAPDAAAGAKSRGALVRDYFLSNDTAAGWAGHAAADGAAYSPFNLLVGDTETLYFVSNHGTAMPRQLRPGVVAISNGHWGEHWPKTDRAESRLIQAIDAEIIAPDALIVLLNDVEPAQYDALPDTGIGAERERFLSPLFIRSPLYGTRAATAIRRRAGQSVEFVEQGFDRRGRAVHRVQQSWPIETCST